MSRILLALLAPWLQGGFFSPSLVNQQAAFAADVSNYIADKTLPLARRQLIAYQFGDALRLPSHSGLTYTATRYERLPLPFQPLTEGIAPPGSAMTIQQVQATAQQWGDRVILTDVANLTIKHPVFKKAVELIGMQLPETLERNTFTTLQSGVQVNFANGKANRAALVATDVLTPLEINRAVGSLTTYGAPRFMGDEREDEKIDADRSPMRGSKSPAVMEHYVAITHPLPAGDMRQNALVAQAWSFSDLNRLYNNDLGAWGGVHFCSSNMVPFWTGFALVTGTASLTGGSLATSATYNIQVVGAKAQTSVEERVHQLSGSISVTGPTGSISVTTPNVPGYIYNIYISTTAVVANLALTALGPTTGPLAGNAVQIPPNTTVVLTGIGAAQTPPAPPATGVTVYPTYIIGRGAYGQVVLEDAEFHYLTGADKSDPLNQTRVASWKVFYGSIFLNQAFMMRIESASAFTPGYTAGTVA